MCHSGEKFGEMSKMRKMAAGVNSFPAMGINVASLLSTVSLHLFVPFAILVSSSAIVMEFSLSLSLSLSL